MKTHEKQVSTPAGVERLLYWSCEALEQKGFVNAFSGRFGNVNENRKSFSEALGVTEWPVVTARQIHSDKLIAVESAAPETEADAVASDQPNFFVGVKTADCLPVLIGDPGKGVFVAIHAGWRGTLLRITEKAVQRLREKFGVDPRTCIAALGPGACGDCFEVGDEVVAQFQTQFHYADSVVKKTGISERAKLDVPRANARQLLEAGLLAENIHSSGLCTMHENNFFFSHRLEGKTDPDRVGRMLSVIGKRKLPS